MNMRHFKPDWEMNAATLLQASSSRRPLDIHREPSAKVVEPDHHRACHGDVSLTARRASFGVGPDLSQRGRRKASTSSLQRKSQIRCRESVTRSTQMSSSGPAKPSLKSSSRSDARLGGCLAADRAPLHLDRAKSPCAKPIAVRHRHDHQLRGVTSLLEKRFEKVAHRTATLVQARLMLWC